MNEPLEPNKPRDGFGDLLPEEPTKRDEQIESLQAALTRERDSRREDQFVGIVILVAVFDIVFFSVMPSFGGPLALLLLELLILVPLAKRMGMEEIATLIDRVLGRIAGKAGEGD